MEVRVFETNAPLLLICEEIFFLARVATQTPGFYLFFLAVTLFKPRKKK